MATLADYLRLIRIEHSVFALPFALAGLLGADWYLRRHPRPGIGGADWLDVALVVVAMVAARTLAMVANRIIDRQIDALNPRTRHRELVTGRVPLGGAYRLAWLSGVVLLGSAGLLSFINRTLWPVALFPLAVLFLVGYSYTKRFTVLCHWILGMCLGGAPLAAWLAVGAPFHWAPVWLGLGVTLWVGGFDVIYSLQDMEFDRAHRIRAVPAWLGRWGGQAVAALSHLGAVILFLLFGHSLGLTSLWYFGGVWLGAVILLVEHLLVARSLSMVGPAFFTANGVLAIVFFIFTWAGVATSP